MRYYYPPVFQFQAILTQSILRISSPSSRSVTALAPLPLRVTNSIPRIIIDERRHRHRQHQLTIHSIRMSSSSSTSPSTEPSKEKNFVVDPFCYRQFAEKDTSKGYAGAVFDIPIEQFEDIVNSRYNSNPSQLKDGYAPFCKHLFLPNDFSNVRVNVLSITPENEQYLRTKYEARNADELPVLTRYFDRELLLNGSDGNGDDIFPVAKYIDLILYSREQINKENAAMGKTITEDDEGSLVETAPWGIVSIKAQDVDYELPMTPITIMRNALGKDQGGSGVELVREAYTESVEYWKDRANVL